MLLAHPTVAAAGAVGAPDPAHGKSVLANVTLHRGAPPPAEAELIAFARERIGYKAPARIRFLAEMPLGPGRETDRAALKKLAAAGPDGG